MSGYIHKHSTTSGKAPLPTEIETGEIALNLADGRAYTKDAGGAIVEVGGGGSSAPAADQTTPGVVELATADEVVAFIDDTRAVTPAGLLHALPARNNRIINGDMRIAQRGASHTGPTDGNYTLDRWQWAIQGTGVVDVTREQDGPPGTEFEFSLKIHVTTGNSVVAADNYARIIQKIEGFNIVDLVGNDCTLGFWVKAQKARTYCTAMTTGSYSYVFEYTVNAPNTWEYKEVVLPGGIPAGALRNTTDGMGLAVAFTMQAGVNAQAPANQWVNKVAYSTANGANNFDAVGNDFSITGVRMVRGQQTNGFERRLYGLEHLLCERYFQKMQVGMKGYIPNNGGSIFCYETLKVPMRATPSANMNGPVVHGGTGPTIALLSPLGFRIAAVSNRAADMTDFNAIVELDAEL